MPIEVHNKENFKKKTAIELRKRGFSYGDIKKSVPVPKSTLASRLKQIKLTDSQLQKLNERRLRTAKRNSEKKILKKFEAIERIKSSSAKDIGKISKRELWLMGIALYWRERPGLHDEKYLRKGIQFSSSDPFVMRFFLKWLQDAGGIKNNELNFDIFIKEEYKGKLNQAISYWSKVMDLQKIYFTQIYVQKRSGKAGKDAVRDGYKDGAKTITAGAEYKYGFLRIRVKASSMMARQMAGWIEGIHDYYWTSPPKASYDDFL